jgi:divalent metal cation (Fe/Co/Zn/Cd) transporter
VSPQVVDNAREVASGVDGVEDVGELRIRCGGHGLHAETRIAVDRDLGLVPAHANTEDTQHALLHDLPMLASAVVHVDP